jgi:hypothetical protein
VLVQTLAGVTALVVVGGLVAAVVLRAVAHPGSRRRPRAPWVTDSAQSARACFRGSVVWQTALLGLAYEALAVLALWLVARSISLALSFALLAVVVPAVLVVTALPFSLGGLGLREASYVVLLHQAGVSTTDATLVSLLATLLFALATLPGAYALVKRSPTRDTGLRAPTSPQELAS